MSTKVTFALCWVLWATGCSQNGVLPGQQSADIQKLPDDVTFTEHIRPMLANNCWRCHGVQQCFGAPMRLVTYADTQTTSEKYNVPMHDRMLARVTATNDTMPPGKPLNTYNQALLRKWVESGSQEGPPKDAPPTPTTCEAQDTSTKTPDLILKAHAEGSEQPLLIVPGSDPGNIYRCFALSVPPPNLLHITRLQPQIDNAAVVHHMAMYTDEGYNNRDSPDGPFGCGDEDGKMQEDWAFMYAWAPGTNGMDFPDDVGMPLSPGQRVVLQLHYHLGSESTRLDGSGIGMFTTSTLRPHEAGMTAMGPTGFRVNVHNPTTEGTCTFPMVINHALVSNPPVRIFASFPHMHGRGLSMHAEHWRGPQLMETFGVADHWSVSAQPNLPEDITVQDGDVVKVACTYTGFDGENDVRFGNRSEDEMCFEFLYTTPPLKAAHEGVPFCPWPL